MKNKLSSIICILSLLFLPTFANATGFSMTNEDIAFFLGLFAVVFLIGYLPYLFLSLRLAKQAETTGATTGTKVIASIFMFVNTTVFLYVFFGSISIILSDMSYATMFGLIAVASAFLWGFPFLAYIKGMRSKGADKSNLLDS
jgi:hypothetical protein